MGAQGDSSAHLLIILFLSGAYDNVPIQQTYQVLPICVECAERGLQVCWITDLRQHESAIQCMLVLLLWVGLCNKTFLKMRKEC